MDCDECCCDEEEISEESSEIVRRKIQVCHNNEQYILTFYEEKLAKENDHLLLTYIIKTSKKEDEVKEKKEKIMTSVGPFVKDCSTRGIQCEFVFHQAKAGEGICEMVKENKPHLVVMGSRGLSKLQRTIQTSVSEYVMLNSTAPVLIIPVRK